MYLSCIYLYFFPEYAVDVEYERENSYTFTVENKTFRVSGASKDSDPSILQCTVDNKTYQVRAVESGGEIHLFTKVTNFQSFESHLV